MSRQEQSVAPEVLNIVECMARSELTAEMYEIYKLFRTFLKGWKFVLASDRGSLPGYAVNRVFSNGAAVRSLFASERVIVLDEETVSDMEKGVAVLPIDFSISLDTQALSYIRHYLSGSQSLPSDFQDVMFFISRPEVNVDPIPYLLENTRFIINGTEEERKNIFKSMEAYEVLRSIDKEVLRNGEIKSYLTESERRLRAQELLSKAAFDRSHKGIGNEIFRRQKTMYCLLLKMVQIQFKRKEGSLESKLMEFFEFMDADLVVMFAREAVVATNYFQSGQKGFFRKIQKRSDKLFSNLQSMSWDLWHIRQCEDGLSWNPKEGARYYFPALLTFDKDLIEVFDMCPMKMCAIDPNNTLWPAYVGDIDKLVAGGSEEIASKIHGRFYSEPAKESRKARRRIGGVISIEHVNRLSARLESELSEVAKVATVS